MASDKEHHPYNAPASGKEGTGPNTAVVGRKNLAAWKGQNTETSLSVGERVSLNKGSGRQNLT